MKVRLSSNESPFGASPAAIDAATRVLTEANRYPDDQSAALRTALAAHLGCGYDEVAVGTGSAALLMDAIPHACATEDDAEVLVFARSFVVYRLAARNAGARYIEVPTAGPATVGQDGYRRDVERLLAHVGATTRAVVVDNPGNPTGAHLTGEQLHHLVDALPEHVMVIVDEAYHDFATGQRGYATVAELGLEHPQLLTLRTFSKAYALAGLRIGAIQGPPALIAALDSRRTRFNVTAPAQAAALASLGDEAHLVRTIDGTLSGRERMAAGLRELGMPFTDGLGNFLTVELGTPAGPIVERFAAEGVGVRALLPYGMEHQVRVSVGTPVEVDTFLDVAGRVLADVPARQDATAV